MKIKKIYLDMDGVLADFNRGIKELCGINPKDQSLKDKNYDDIMWEAIRNVDHFYDKLELIPDALEMYKSLSDKYDVEILSGIPKPHRGIVTSAEDKINWAHRILSKDLKVNIVYRAEKKNYVTGSDCILIDDLEKNILEWNQCGGTGILFKSAKMTLEAIRQLDLC